MLQLSWMLGVLCRMPALGKVQALNSIFLVYLFGAYSGKALTWKYLTADSTFSATEKSTAI